MVDPDNTPGGYGSGINQFLTERIRQLASFSGLGFAFLFYLFFTC